MQRLKVNERYRRSGIYIVFFDTGIKIGMTQEIQKRLQSYKNPWSQPISCIMAYAAPVLIVNDMERHLLSQFEFRKREYIFNENIGDLDVKLLNTFTKFYEEVRKLKIDF
jgi:hypothetical protein